MDSLNNLHCNDQTKQSIMTTVDHDDRHRIPRLNYECIICGSKGIGINFGVPTCAPCKAFFRRNARRKEILESPCHHLDTNFSIENNVNEKNIRYFQIRRCTSCRLHRCFEIGMKEELIRTDDENQRHRQLVDINRKRRELIKQKQQQNQLAIPQSTMNGSDLLYEIDWRHLSNIVSAFDTHCLKTYVEQREKMLSRELSSRERRIEDYAVFPMSAVASLSSFARALPAFQTLSRNTQTFLCENNIRRLIFVNLHELNQSCFSEPYQITAYQAGWELICGSELYKDFRHIEYLGEKLIIADPIVTRLWLVTLLFSTPLFSYYDSNCSITKIKKKLPFVHTQHAYATLLWKYLLYRHGQMESVRIYSSLIQVYLDMLRVGVAINMRFRAQMDFKMTHETLEKVATLDINDP